MKGVYSLVVCVVAFVVMNVTFSHADKLPAKQGNGVLIGHVVYPNGKPAAGIRVLAVMERPFIWELTQKGFLTRTPGGVFTEEAQQFFASQQNLAGITQADGTFRIKGLITAPYDLLVTTSPDDPNSSMEGSPRDWTAVAAVGVWGKQDKTIHRSQNIVLTRGAVIHGKVTDTNGKPMAGIIVASTGPHRPDVSDTAAGTITDGNGEYFMRVPPGEITVYLAGPSKVFTQLNGGESVAITLNGKLITSDKAFSAQTKFPAIAQKSYDIDFHFSPKR
jgi:hypothetical protein